MVILTFVGLLLLCLSGIVDLTVMTSHCYQRSRNAYLGGSYLTGSTCQALCRATVLYTFKYHNQSGSLQGRGIIHILKIKKQGSELLSHLLKVAQQERIQQLVWPCALPATLHGLLKHIMARTSLEMKNTETQRIKNKETQRGFLTNL